MATAGCPPPAMRTLRQRTKARSAPAPRPARQPHPPAGERPAARFRAGLRRPDDDAARRGGRRQRRRPSAGAVEHDGAGRRGPTSRAASPAAAGRPARSARSRGASPAVRTGATRARELRGRVVPPPGPCSSATANPAATSSAATRDGVLGPRAGDAAAQRAQDGAERTGTSETVVRRVCAPSGAPGSGACMAGELDGMRVAVLATDGVEQVELDRPWQALEEAGAEPELVSLESGHDHRLRPHRQGRHQEGRRWRSPTPTRTTTRRWCCPAGSSTATSCAPTPTPSRS